MRRWLPALLTSLLFLAAAVPGVAEDPPAEAPAEAPAALDLSAYHGKVVYLDFWASWCVPCKQSFPWMMELLERHAEQGLVVLTVNVEPDRDAADAFAERMHSTLPVIYDPEGKLAAAYALEAMPSSFVYGRDGSLRATHLGFHPKETAQMEAEIQKLLSEDSKVVEEKP